MDLTVLIDNIDRLKGTMKDHALSMKAGREDAMRNLRRYASGELKGTWTLDTLEAVAKALGTSSWELLRPPSAVSMEQDLDERVNRIIDERLGSSQPVRKRKSR